MKPIFRVIIAGSRSFDNATLMQEFMDYYLRAKANTHRIIVISGEARGADTAGENYAKSRGYRVERYPAQWDTYGRRAGMLRNAVMGSKADVLVAFWDGVSTGTKHMIDTMRNKNKPYRVVLYKEVTECPK